MTRFTDKVVLVTGASGGLGVEVARAFARRGARLAVTARSPEPLHVLGVSLAGEGTQVLVHPADVGELDQLRGLVDRVLKEWGGIDVLVNNAGIEEVGDFEATSPTELEAVVRVNLLGPSWLTRLVVPHMIARGGGHVVNVASMSGLLPDPHNAIYSATKHGLVGLSRSLRMELAEHRIGVTLVCPTYVDGGMFLDWNGAPPVRGERVSPQEVAAAVVEGVERDEPVRLVAGPLGRAASALQAIWPRGFEAMYDRSGVPEFTRAQAERRKESDREPR